MNQTYYYPGELMKQEKTPVRQDYSRNNFSSQMLDPLRDALNELLEKKSFNTPCKIALKLFIQALDRDTASTKEGRIDVVDGLKNIWMKIKKPIQDIGRENTNKSMKNTPNASAGVRG